MSTLPGLKRVEWEDFGNEFTNPTPQNTNPHPSDAILATVILPAFNEALALPKVLTDIHESLDHCFEVIVVDDGSTDETAIIAENYPCRVIRHKCNQGKGAAVRTGIRHARGQLVVIMDADATYPPSVIPHLVDLLHKYDMVRCIRQVRKENMPVINQIGNRLFDFLLSAVLGLDGNDQLSGLYGLSRNSLIRMDLESDGFDLEAEINFKARIGGLKVYTFPIVYNPRLGDKKLHAWRDGCRILNRILSMLLIYKPSWIFTLPGLIIIVLAVFGATILKETPIFAPYLGLSISSFILATLGILTGFQLMTFGTAAALCGVEAGNQLKPWMQKICSAKLRIGAASFGIGLTAYGSGFILSMINDWWNNHPGPFQDIRSLLVASTILIWGLQLLSAVLFISIFAGRLRKFIEE